MAIILFKPLNCEMGYNKKEIECGGKVAIMP